MHWSPGSSSWAEDCHQGMGSGYIEDTVENVSLIGSRVHWACRNLVLRLNMSQFVNPHYTYLLSSSVIVRLRTSQRRNDCQETIPIREIDHQYHISALYVDALASHTVLFSRVISIIRLIDFVFTIPGMPHKTKGNSIHRYSTTSWVSWAKPN